MRIVSDRLHVYWLKNSVRLLILLLKSLPKPAQINFFLDLNRREGNESVKIAMQNIELIEGLL
jgi:hypothetical protein